MTSRPCFSARTTKGRLVSSPPAPRPPYGRSNETTRERVANDPSGPTYRLRPPQRVVGLPRRHLLLDHERGVAGVVANDQRDVRLAADARDQLEQVGAFGPVFADVHGGRRLPCRLDHVGDRCGGGVRLVVAPDRRRPPDLATTEALVVAHAVGAHLEGIRRGVDVEPDVGAALHRDLVGEPGDPVFGGGGDLPRRGARPLVLDPNPVGGRRPGRGSLAGVRRSHRRCTHHAQQGDERDQTVTEYGGSRLHPARHRARGQIGLGARRVQALQQVVRGAARPPCGATPTRGRRRRSARCDGRGGSRRNERVARLRLVGSRPRSGRGASRVLVPRMRLEERVLRLGARLDVTPSLSSTNRRASISLRACATACGLTE